MDQPRVGFDNWPFSKGEKVKLIKISKPYSDEGIWYIDAVFLSKISKRVKRLKYYFGDLHLLICGADYVDGKRQEMQVWTTIDVYISSRSKRQRRPKAYHNKDKIKQDEFDYYTFGIGDGSYYYIIPLYEILRSILAPDIFWLNQVTSLDSIDTRVVYEKTANDLQLAFLNDVPVRYVEMDEKIRHVAWVFSNQNIYDMIHQCYHNIRSQDGIKFDFLFDEFYFTGKVEVFGNITYVKEICSFKEKIINCRNIFVYHQGLVEYEKKSDEIEKKWTPVRKVSGDRSLVSDRTATPNKLDIVGYESLQSEYWSFVKIKRMRSKKSGGTEITPTTVPVNVGGNKKRTTADFGGLVTIPQLEFMNNVEVKLSGQFADIFVIFSLMEERDEILSIGYHVGELNDHFRFRSVCTLTDKSPRKYLSAIIQCKDGRKAMLIEVERENLLLTTLILVSRVEQNWNLICHEVMKGLIKNSGTWPDIKNLGFAYLEAYKFKHTKADLIRRENRMFNSIYLCKNF